MNIAIVDVATDNGLQAVQQFLANNLLEFLRTNIFVEVANLLVKPTFVRPLYRMTSVILT